MKVYIKPEKIILQFSHTEIKKQTFHQHKRPISIKNIDMNKIVVSNKVSFGKKKIISLATKNLKKLSLYVYFS